MPPCIVIFKLKTKLIFSWYAMSSSPILDLLHKVDLLLHFAESTLKFAKQLRPLIEAASSDDDIDHEDGAIFNAGAEEGFDEEEAAGREDRGKKKRKVDDF